MLLVVTPKPDQEPANYVLCRVCENLLEMQIFRPPPSPTELGLLGAQVQYSLLTLSNVSLKSLKWVWLTVLHFAFASVGRPDVQSQGSDRLNSSLLQGVVLNAMSELSPYSLRQSSNMVTIFGFLLQMKKLKHKANTSLVSDEKSQKVPKSLLKFNVTLLKIRGRANKPMVLQTSNVRGDDAIQVALL